MQSPINTQQQKELRKSLRNNMTVFEKALWLHLKNDQLGYRCRRQVGMGRYIVDFCYFEKKLIIEIDGAQHTNQSEYDQERTDYLEVLGFKVLRFWNHDIKDNLPSVLKRIYTELHTDRDSLPTSL